MEIEITPDLIEGAVSFRRRGHYLQPWRLPEKESFLFDTFNNMLIENSCKTSGVRLRFRTDSSRIRLTIDTSVGLGIYELTIGEEIVGSDTASHDRNWVEMGGLEGMHTYELWLPHLQPCALGALVLDDGARFEAALDHRLKWLIYGSSISHCHSDTPTGAWPSIAARKYNLNLTSLGIGGQCHHDPCVARVIRDREADIITCKLGINVYGSGSLNRRTYYPSVMGLIAIIREKHPVTPLGITTSIYSCERESQKNVWGMTLEDYREETRQAVSAFRSNGDENLLLFEGTDLLGEADAQYLPDDLHPDQEGNRLMGERAGNVFLEQLIRECEKK